MILVTGGTGLVGSHLLFKLISEGENVRAIYRREHKLEQVKHVFAYFSDNPDAIYNAIDWIEADITDIPAMTAAFNGINFVYHCAALVSFEPDKYNILKKINIEGTANVVNLCLAHHVKKLCYVSSVAALGAPKPSEQFIDESTQWNKELDNSVYAITKYGAEIEVWRGVQEGLTAVIVNPGIIIGAGFWNAGGSGSLFKQVYKGMSHYTTGTSGFVDIWDVVNAMTLLMKSDLKNEKFVLVSENLSFKDFFTQVAHQLKVNSPQKEAKQWMLSIAWRVDWLRFKLLGKRRKLSKQMAKSAVSKTRFSSDKIKKQLEFEFKPMANSIADTAKLFRRDFNKN